MEQLPEGLLSTAARVPLVMDDSMPVDVLDITSLWKAYSVKPSALDGNLGYRLENFFWRIGSNDCLRDSLPGAAVAKLFMRISESSVPKTLELQDQDMAIRKNKSEEQLSLQRDAPPDQGPPLHSILKKPNTAPKDTTNSARLLVAGDDRPAAPVSPVKDVSISRHSHKKTHFVTGKAAKSSKRRPVITRRKSSQPNISTKAVHSQSPKRMLSSRKAPKHVRPEDEDEDEDEERLWSISRCSSPDLEDCMALPQHIADRQPEKPRELPEEFVTNLKVLLSLRPRKASWKTAPLTMGFRSQVPNRFRDIRYLYIQNYMPRPPSIVNAEFRAHFLEKMREEQVELASLLDKEKLQQQQQQSFNTEGTSPDPTDFSGTFGVLNSDASTAPTTTPHMSIPGQFCGNPIGLDNGFLDVSGGIPRSFFHHTPLPLPRLSSQLGMMIEESRRSNSLEYHRPDPSETIGPQRLSRSYIDTLVEWNIKWLPSTPSSWGS
ncbi:GATA-like domain-containing protein [Aspergillus clavatus NRRL 1]|uniref:Nitrogen regulatory protein areA GATA-like domain-containing protein n=1 Tax=Aspergillus clavatus (strain ATCC 1007 / CBS 513.65 / DSM 816 / NCTC 3887 / NRRL 1 / QM 1276 / 107) TaxID=344612 RepID=A1CAH2_ASPCL|nr:uncharacterized protein ACLA_011670 [Aspergillus clavatus NRRL 1]EAW12740.1 conserved hypothetical protein [Aspergillus clavatus NRRL 1]